jgi:hypothetical protein
MSHIDRVVLSEILPEIDAANPIVGFCKFADGRPAFVRPAIVHQDDLKRFSVQRLAQPIHQGGQNALAAIGGHDH